MSSPWAKIDKPESVSLKDIMSEQLADDLQSREDKFIAERIHEELNGAYQDDVEPIQEVTEPIQEAAASLEELSISDGGNVCESDEIIAYTLQADYDRMFNEELMRNEKKHNAMSKIGISFSNYRRGGKDYDSQSEEDEPIDPIEQKNWDRFDPVMRQFSKMPPCGYQMQKDGSMLTKHDVNMSAVRNACKLMSFPPEFETGDSAAFDVKLSNPVYNSLKLHSKNEQMKKIRAHDRKDDRATASSVMDTYTADLLYRLINTLHILADVTGVIQIGKEASVLHATGNVNCTTQEVPEHCCVKIFKTTLSEYKQRDQYIKEDHRFKDRIGNQPTRKTVHIWAEKEMANLQRLKRAGIPCPYVICQKKHLLVMNLIGVDSRRPAPTLKNYPRKVDDLILAYGQIVEIMADMYRKANLIHADLSEYNILWHEKQCYIIDVSQSVEPSQENASYLLMRDCTNITHFFRSKKIPGVIDAAELYKNITGIDYKEAEAYLAIRPLNKSKPHRVNHIGDQSFHFESTWEKVMMGHLPVPEKAFNEEDCPKLVDPPNA